MTTTAPIHPGEHLAEVLDESRREDANEPRYTQESIWRRFWTSGVAPVRINEIVHRRRSITADTALRIGSALRMTPEFWLNLQRMYDLDLARASTDTSAIKPLVEAST